MPDRLDEFATLVRTKLTGYYPRLPSNQIIRQLLETSYLATLKTEEGRFIRGSLTLADPTNPEQDPPIIRRANFPAFTPFGHRIALSIESLVKLSRAIDSWSGSIAVFGTTKFNLYAWGVADQLVHHNVLLNREGHGGFVFPGILTISMEGPGELAVYHGSLFVARLQQDKVIAKEPDVLMSITLKGKLLPVFMPIALRIARYSHAQLKVVDVASEMHREWAKTIARLCIGLRRLGTGGAFLISANPVNKHLDINYALPYKRLRDGVILGIVEQRNFYDTRNRVFQQSKDVPTRLVHELNLSEADSEDRELETSGAVRVVTTLAAIDGAIVLTPTLEVIGFGVKIKSASTLTKVYDAESFLRRGIRAKKHRASDFGMRHTSVLRYCKADPRAIGVVVSQDGHVRIVTTIGRSLVLWKQIRLLDYDDNSKRYFRQERRARLQRDKERQKAKLGYGPMPKTFSKLMHS